MLSQVSMIECELSFVSLTKDSGSSPDAHIAGHPGLRAVGFNPAFSDAVSGHCLAIDGIFVRRNRGSSPRLPLAELEPFGGNNLEWRSAEISRGRDLILLQTEFAWTKSTPAIDSTLSLRHQDAPQDKYRATHCRGTALMAASYCDVQPRSYLPWRRGRLDHLAGQRCRL